MARAGAKGAEGAGRGGGEGHHLHGQADLGRLGQWGLTIPAWQLSRRPGGSPCSLGMSDYVNALNFRTDMIRIYVGVRGFRAQGLRI